MYLIRMFFLIFNIRCVSLFFFHIHCFVVVSRVHLYILCWPLLPSLPLISVANYFYKMLLVYWFIVLYMFVCAFEQFNGRSVTRNQVTKKGVKKVSDMMSNGLTTNGALIIGSYLMLLVYRFFCDLFLLILLYDDDLYSYHFLILWVILYH